ncbi:MAG: OmpA family protein [Gammaproteobacteria bacterium]|nr:OmpA family protein [Gammaproteobacteria bacterium]MDH5323447.1 OmpA family protein [Gammaproteobacteria bacterium]
MPARQRRQIRAILSLALLAVAALFALPVDNGLHLQIATSASANLFDEPQFAVHLGRNHLRISGSTVSDEHEADLLQLAEERFAGAMIETDFRKAVILSPDWETLSIRLLYLVAATESAQAVLDSNGIEIRGVSRDEPDYERRRQFLRDATGANRTLVSDMISVDSNVSFDALCRRNFDNFASEPIQFRQSGTGIRESSQPLLDRVAEFAYDCDRSRIAVIGHSDATGSADGNLQISRARAAAVAAALQLRGVARDRLIVEGRGATQPIASNDTVAGRERNRRIEFELR